MHKLFIHLPKFSWTHSRPNRKPASKEGCVLFTQGRSRARHDYGSVSRYGGAVPPAALRPWPEEFNYPVGARRSWGRGDDSLPRLQGGRDVIFEITISFIQFWRVVKYWWFGSESFDFERVSRILCLRVRCRSSHCLNIFFFHKNYFLNAICTLSRKSDTLKRQKL